MTRAFTRLLAACWLVALGAAAVRGQEAPPVPGSEQAEAVPTFPTEIEQVIVDLVVTDRRGNPIRGLGRGDLQVSEDGVAQSIVTFEAVELPDVPAEAPPPKPRVSSNATPEVERGRTFVIVFDDIHLTPGRANRAKAAVADFLHNGVREGDRVTLVSTGGTAWWTTRMEAGREELLTLLKRLDGRYIPDTSSERMSEWEAMRIHVFRDSLVAERVLRRYETYGVAHALARSQDEGRGMAYGTVDDPFVTARASEVYFQATARNRIVLEIVERALNSLAATKGRKSVILVSEGFIYDPNLDLFKRVNEASRGANAAIYFVNSRGLEGMPTHLTAAFGPALPEQDVGFAFAESFEAVEGAESLAADSGGFTVRNANDLGAGIRRIADETRVYYLVGYNPTNTARDGRFRKIQVRVPGRRGMVVRARRGYYAPSDGESALVRKSGADPVIQAALDSPYAIDQIPLRMTHYVGAETLLGKAGVVVATEVDVGAMEFEEKEGRFTSALEMLLVVAHRETGEFFRYDQKVDMRLLPATRERLGRTWYPIHRDFELRPGGYQAKIVVRDQGSGRVGTVVHEFEVPALEHFRVSTPVLSDTQHPAAEGAAFGAVVPLARRAFPEGARLLCSFEVYGAAKDDRGMPRVSMGYAVRRADGSVFTRMAPSVINPTSLGKLSRLIGFSLDSASPGEYELVMSFKDELNGETLEMKEPFTVLPESQAGD